MKPIDADALIKALQVDPQECPGCPEPEHLGEIIQLLQEAPDLRDESFEWCTDCREYDQERHCCHRFTKVIRQTVDELRKERHTGKWVKISGGMSPGGTPAYVCGRCGGSEHLHGAEYPRRKLYCDVCGDINSYPWEKTYEEEQ